MQVSCLTKTYYVKLQHPLDIIFLEESCEASTVSMLLPSRTVLSKEVDSSQLGIRLDQLKLHYQKIQDFTIISNTPIEKLTPQQLESKASYIPEMENISLDKFNTTMTEINKEYPWQMPVWLKIILTIGITIFIIGAMIDDRVRGVHLGWCLSKRNQYGTNNQNITFKNASRNISSNSNLRSVHIEHPHFEEMRPLQETECNSRTKGKKMTKATPDLVAEAWSELSDLDFTKFYKKKSGRANRLQTTLDL